MKRCVVLMGCLLIVSTFAGAQGIKLPASQFAQASGVGAGARAMAMGGAFIAIADDATAASWNPAGVTQLVEPEVSISAEAINRFRDIYPEEDWGDWIDTEWVLKRREESFGFFSILWPIPLKTDNVRMVGEFSYQRVVNQGLDLESVYQSIFPDGSFVDWAIGSTLSGGIDIYALTLGTGTERYSGGISVNLWRNGASEHTYWRGNLQVGSLVFGRFLDAETHIEDDFKGTNMTLGFLGKPHDKLSVGCVFKTPFTGILHISEKSSFNGTRFGDAKIKWPYTVGGGVAYSLLPRARVAFDYTRTDWSNSEIRNVPVFPGETFSNDPEPFPTGSQDQADSEQFRFGGEYVHMYKGFILPIRGGFFYNKTFSHDLNDDQITSMGITVGGGFGIKKFIIDAAFVREFGDYPVSSLASDNLEFRTNRLIVTSVFRP